MCDSEDATATRRAFLAGTGGALAGTLAGCGDAMTCEVETWTGLDYTVAVTDVEYDAWFSRWRTTCRVRVYFSYGSGGSGIRGTELAAFGTDGALLSTTSLGDLTWSMVEDPSSFEECDGHTYESGGFAERAAVTTDGFPRWVGLRYGAVDASRRRGTVSVYDGPSMPDTDPTPGEYEQVARKDAGTDDADPAFGRRPLDPRTTTTTVQRRTDDERGRTATTTDATTTPVEATETDR